MKTVTIQIGNSDDKLLQREWADYVKRINEFVQGSGYVHFFSTSPNTERWQNACWVMEPSDDMERETLRSYLKDMAREYRQDSVAWTEGKTEFI